MGTNKRYDLYSAKLGAENEAYARRPRPISLPDAVLRQTGRRRDEDRPVPVQAQVPVQIAYTDVQLVDAVAIAWTPGGAVLLRYTPEGESHDIHVWVWASSVRRK